MAKWKKGVMADVIFNSLIAAEAEGIITSAEVDELRTKIGKALNIHDLLPRRFHQAYIRNWLMGEKRKLLFPTAGPVGKLDGNITPSPPTNVVPKIKFLQKLKEKQAA